MNTSIFHQKIKNDSKKINSGHDRKSLLPLAFGNTKTLKVTKKRVNIFIFYSKSSDLVKIIFRLINNHSELLSDLEKTD